MGKQLENKWVFKRLQKTGKVCADVMSGGRLVIVTYLFIYFSFDLETFCGPFTFHPLYIRGLFLAGPSRRDCVTPDVLKS